MRKTKPGIILSITILLLSSRVVSAAAQYQEIDTRRGKVIIGLEREKAYQKFGPPVSISDDLWYYAGPPEFYVNFSESPAILLYPNYCQAAAGIPVEFKAYLSLPDLEIQDITREVELISDKPEYLKFQGPGVIIPKKAGEYQALVRYRKSLSSPLYLKVKQSGGSEQKEKKKLLNIDILPYRPLVAIEGLVDFVALGTFFDYDLNEYSVKEITKEADWFIRRRPGTFLNNEKSRRLYFLKTGQAEVLCRYKEVESFPQRAQIQERVDYGIKRLKHILTLPEMMVVLLNSNISVKAFATYNDNSVEEITNGVKWRIKNTDVLESNKEGYFFAKSEGVTEVTASKDGLDALPIKIVVVNKTGHFSGLVVDAYQEKVSKQNALARIKDDLENLEKDLSIRKKELTAIKITPQSLDMALGERGRFSAAGIYSDGSQMDLTILGSWESSDKNVATVSGGTVSTVSAGQTSMYVKFRGVRSEYAKVTVGRPMLISLLLTPQNLKIPRDGKARLKVQGKYYDNSERDLTSLVSWGREGRAKVVKIENGILRPLRFGKTNVYAEYLQTKSNTAGVNVVLTLGWLLRLLAKIIFILLLCALIIFSILYWLVQNRKKQMLSLRDRPREFILSLYENASRLTAIFGQGYDAHIPPLLYAELVKKKFLVEDNDFMNFSIKFEEAKYSKHDLENSHLVLAANDYGHFFEKLFRNQNKILSWHRYCLALIYCRPIFIIAPPLLRVR